ncbi:cadherin-like domain-containing protein [Microvirga rosea]|uniref:cadherin-like domain-containing protein n=1 Tax=Microvirga rosea TaxID=2715425 RepID=UPI001D0A8A1C|nr:cadherin-like domain-containing protein [Microvirga rosea]MCB8820584.1 DUF4347 domain-containing protein [Microvirga rosea]
MYDAAIAATAKTLADTAQHAADQGKVERASGEPVDTRGSGQQPEHATDVGPFGDKGAAALAQAQNTGVSHVEKPSEIAFVDSTVADVQTLAARRNVEIVMLDPTRDGIAQISEVLAQRHDLTAIHVVSHGDGGEIRFGTTNLNADTLGARASAIAGWSAALKSGSDIMIWGCDVAAVPAGDALISGLSALTGADVAASVDLTGSAERGGNWTLEHATGSIETTAPFEASSLAAWDHLLDPPSITSTKESLTVVEPSALNADALADRVTLHDWSFGTTAIGNVTVTAVVGDTSVGSLFDASGRGTTITGGWRFTGTLAEANTWLQALTFRAKDVELGTTSAKTAITLSITDADSVSTSKSIDVTVTPSNDPTVLSGTITQNVTEGAANVDITVLTRAGGSPTVIDPEVGTGSSGYQTAGQIVYTVTEGPAHGYITLNGQRLGVGSIFTQADVEANRVKYTHTATGESQNTTDGFRVRVNDGATPIAQSADARINLQIVPVNSSPTIGTSIVSVYEGQPYNPSPAGGSGRTYTSIGDQIVATNGGDLSSDTLTVTVTALPTKGELYFNGVKITGTSFSFAYADRAKLTYRHFGAEPDQDPASAEDSFSITVTDAGGGTGTQKSASRTIGINVRPVDDDPQHSGLIDIPTNNNVVSASVGSDVLGVPGQGVILTPDMLNVTDVDSTDKSLTFNIKEAPTDGVILIKGSDDAWYRLKAGDAFSMADIRNGRVIYLQLTSNSDDSRPLDHFTYTVTDGALRLAWQANGTDFTRPGGVYDNSGLSPSDALTVFRFNIDLAVMSGDGTFTGTDFPTVTAPVPAGSLYMGDNPSVPGTNTQFLEGASSVITQGMLSYSSGTVPPEQIVYTLTGLPSNGALELKVGAGWVALGAFATFTQADINAGNLRFTHDGNEVFKSQFGFSVTAGGMSGGSPLATTGTFDLYATPVNDAPTANGSSGNVLTERDTSTGVSAPAQDGTGVRYITTGMLNFSDPDDANSEDYIEHPENYPDGSTYLGNSGRNNGSAGFKPLQIMFTRLPSAGTLEFWNGSAWVAIQANTIYTLNGDPNNTGLGAPIIVIAGTTGTTGLRYVNGGSEANADSFDVQVVDNFGQTAATSVGFDITPVNDPPRVIVNVEQIVYEGQAAQLTTAFLNLDDPDSTNLQVQVRITEATKYGRIVRDRDGDGSIADGRYDVIGIGSAFTYADLLAGRIFYIQDGQETYQEKTVPQDNFKFTLADGSAETTGNVFNIKILPTNDAPTIGGIPTVVKVVGSSDPASGLNKIPGISIKDVDIETYPNYAAGASNEHSEIQVTIRLRDDATGVLLSNYAGITIGYDAAASAGVRVVNSGVDSVLTLYGTLDQINAALAGLSITFDTDRNHFYRVEIIADDRTRDAATNTIQASANGGSKNAPATPGGDLTDIPATDPDPTSGNFGDAASKTPLTELAGNVALASFRIYATNINNPPTLTSTAPPIQPTEDTNIVIIRNDGANRVVIGDVEGQDLNNVVTLTLKADNGILDVGANGPRGGTLNVSGSTTGTVVITGTITEIQALLDAGVTYRGNSNYNGGDTVTLTIDDQRNGGDADHDGTSDIRTSTLTLTLLDAVDVNDKPTLNVGSGQINVAGNTVGGIFGPNAVADTDGNGQVTVTVRLLDSGTPVASGGYSGVSFGYGALGGVSIIQGFDGAGKPLVIQGSVSEVNAILQSLTLSFGLGAAGDGKYYSLQVVVDDRARDASGMLAGGANGGNVNQTNSGSPGTFPQAVPSTDFTPYQAAPAVYNVVTGTRNVFVSGINDPAEITAGNIVVSEHGTVDSVVLTGITVTDVDNGGNGTMSITISVPQNFLIGKTLDGRSGASGTITLTNATPAQINTWLAGLSIFFPTPDGNSAYNYNGSPVDITVVVNDGGSVGSRPGSPLPIDYDGSDPSTYDYADGTSSALVTTRIFTLTVAAENDAPVWTNTGAVVIPSVQEDSAGTVPQTVQDLFGSRFSDPGDDATKIGGATNPGGSTSNSFAGVAVVGYTADASKGQWYYRPQGSTDWVLIGTVANGQALILNATDEVRFVPTANYNGAAPTLTVRIVETGGTPDYISGRIANLTQSGGTTIYSAGTVVLQTNITPVNDRPVVPPAKVGTDAAISTAEDATSTPQTLGVLLASWFSDAVDGAGPGTSMAYVAIIGNAATAAQGKWQWLQGGTWTDIPVNGLSDSSALVLDASAQIRFVPNADYNGAPGKLTVRLADGSTTLTKSTTPAQLFDLTLPANGNLNLGTGSWSADTVGVQMTVTPVNDRPTASDVQLPAFNEDTTPSSGRLSDLFSGTNYSDATDDQPGSAGTPFGGVAIIGNTANATTQGKWQYSADGITWTDIRTTVSTANAILLGAGYSVRFLPVADYNGAPPALQVLASDTPVSFSASTNLGTLTQTSHWSTVHTIGVSITPVEDTPRPVNDTNTITAGATSISKNAATGVLQNDKEVDGQNLSVQGVAAGNTGAASSAGVSSAITGAHGTLTLQADGSYVYTLNNADPAVLALRSGQTITDVFTYTMTDGTSAAQTATLTITINGVNDAPAIDGGGNTLSGREDTPLTLTASDFKFADVDSGDTLASVKITSLPASGTLLRNGVAVTAGTVVTVAEINAGKLTFVPATNRNGPALVSFGYQVSDGTVFSSTGTMTIDVTPVNDTPVPSGPSTASVTEDTTLVFDGVAGANHAGGLSFTDVIDLSQTGATDHFTITVSVSHGTVSMTGPSGLVNGTSVTLSGTQAELTAALATLAYRPTSGYSGTDQLILLVDDGTNGGGGPGAGSPTASKTVDITITPVSDTPTLTVSAAAGDEDTWIPLDIVVGQTDPDGSETLSLQLTNLPAGWQIRIGNDAALTSIGSSQIFTFSGTDLARGLSIHAPNDVNTAPGTPLVLGLTAVSKDGAATPATLSGTIEVTVRPINDRPIASGNAILPSVNEDTANPPGQTVSSLFGGNYSDTTDSTAVSKGAEAATPLKGIAITGNAAVAAQGVWQYDLGDGHWQTIPTSGLDDGHALIIPATALIRFVPAADFAGTPGKLTVRLADGTEALNISVDPANLRDLGMAGNGALGTRTGRWSAATVDLSTVVNAVNDRPIGTDATLPTFNEDQAPSIAKVRDLFGSGYGDATDNKAGIVGGIDSSTPLGGIAIVANNANPTTEGRWQCRDGGAWIDIPTGLTDSNALFLTNETEIRFLPVQYYNGTPPALTMRVSDVPIAASGPGVVVPGQTSQWSDPHSLGVTIDPINNAPTISGGGNVLSTVEDGQIVLSVSDFHFADVDTGDALASVIIVTKPINGGLYLDGILVPDGATISAADIAAGKLVFRPAGDQNGSGYGNFVYKVSDGTAPSANGTMVIDVMPANDRPVATGSATLPSVAEDAVNPPGRTVADLFGGNYSDVADSAAVSHGTDAATPLVAIAIVGNAATVRQGVWQYDLGDGAGWRTVPASGLDDAHALVLPTTALIRFVPARDFTGQPGELSVRLSDGTVVVPVSTDVADRRNLSDAANGALGTQTGAWSASQVALGTTIDPVNDAPQIIGKDLTVPEGSPSVSLAGLFAVSDPDLGKGLLSATLSVPEGFRILSLGGAGGIVTGLGTGTVVIAGVTQAQLQAHLDALHVALSGPDGTGPGSAAHYSGTFAVTLKVSDSGSTGARPDHPVSGSYFDTNNPLANPGDFAFADGTSSALVTTRTISITVTPVSNAPSLQVPLDVVVNQDQPFPIGIQIGDVDLNGPGETLSVVISGIPAGWVLRSGETLITVQNGQSAPIDPAMLAGLTFVPAAGWNSRDHNGGRTLVLTVRGISVDQGAPAAMSLGTFNVFINPAARVQPTMTPVGRLPESYTPGTAPFWQSDKALTEKAFDSFPYLEARSVERVATTWQTISHQLMFRQINALQQGPLFYEARMGDNMPLPAWVSFDASTQTVTATPGDFVPPGVYVIRVVARDVAGNEAQATFTVHVIRDNHQVTPSQGEGVNDRKNGEPAEKLPSSDDEQKQLPADQPKANDNEPETGKSDEVPQQPETKSPQPKKTDESRVETRQETTNGKLSLSAVLFNAGRTGQFIEAARLMQAMADELDRAS